MNCLVSWQKLKCNLETTCLQWLAFQICSSTYKKPYFTYTQKKWNSTFEQIGPSPNKSSHPGIFHWQLSRSIPIKWSFRGVWTRYLYKHVSITILPTLHRINLKLERTKPYICISSASIALHKMKNLDWLLRTRRVSFIIDVRVRLWL